MTKGEITDPPHVGNDGFEASATFGQPQNNLLVSVKADAVNFHASGLAALERMAQHNPDLAKQIIDATSLSETHETQRYTVAAITAGIVCCVMLASVAYIISNQGFLAGIAFFLVCAAVAAIFSAVFTGKSQSLSWTANLMPGAKGRQSSEGDGD